MKFEEFIASFINNNVDLPPLPVKWIKHTKIQRPINSIPLGSKKLKK